MASKQDVAILTQAVLQDVLMYFNKNPDIKTVDLLKELIGQAYSGRPDENRSLELMYLKYPMLSINNNLKENQLQKLNIDMNMRSIDEFIVGRRFFWQQRKGTILDSKGNLVEEDELTEWDANFEHEFLEKVLKKYIKKISVKNKRSAVNVPEIIVLIKTQNDDAELLRFRGRLSRLSTKDLTVRCLQIDVT